jgi:DNA-binding SARP family transcriptional activator
LVAFSLESANTLPDEHGVNAGLDGRDLALKALVEVCDLVNESRPLLSRLVGFDAGGHRRVLHSEVTQAIRSKDVRGEELLDHVRQAVLAYVLPLAVSEGFGCVVAVVAPVAAGVVGVALGGLSLHTQRIVPRGDGLLGRIKRAATHELLAYLAFHPKGASRDELIEAIWPAQDPERTRPRFWQSVTEARKALGDAWVHHGERYELDRSKVRVDLDDLDRLLAANSDDTGHDPAALESALALWRGEPLEGSDYLWAEGEVRVLHATLVDLLGRVGRSRLAHDDARGALQMADQAIALDGLHEPSWRLALQAEHALGLRESITRRYDELTRSLDEQLGLEPARETRVIYRQLLGQT